MLEPERAPLFLADVLDKPARLAALADAYEGPTSPLAELSAFRATGRHVVFVGLGSSRYAALTAAHRLRAEGMSAVAERASSAASPPSPDTLLVAISASGTTPEVVEASRRHHGTSLVVAVTNDPGAELTRHADVVLPLRAGPEAGGVSCLTYPCTQAVLALLCDRLLEQRADTGTIRRGAESCRTLIEEREAWLEPLSELVAGAQTVHVIAGGERYASACQSALMLRECPRATALASDAGDWLHVDVYLTVQSGYAALLLGSSPYVEAILGWIRKRGGRAANIGFTVPGTAKPVRYPGDEDPGVALLVETTVSELVAAQLWSRP